MVGLSRIDEDHARLELAQHARLQAQRLDIVMVRVELHEVEAAEDGGVLILPAAGNVEHEPLRLERQLGNLMAVPAIGAELVEAAEDRAGDDGRSAQARAYGEVGRKLQVEAVGGVDEAHGRLDEI